MAGQSVHPTLTDGEVLDHLRQCGYRCDEVERIGAGHWSVCFGFAAHGGRLVIRFGHHREDFEKDRAAHRFQCPDLPVPEVLEVGHAFKNRTLGGPVAGCQFAISERVEGIPLESVEPDRWAAVVLSVAAAIEAMRLAELPADAGWGPWSLSPDTGLPLGTHRSWRAYILSAADEPDDGRITGWKTRLAANRQGMADFDWGLELLDRLLDDEINTSVEVGITHQDMINRNVHVADDRITGLFDWGCAAYTDPLYEPALFEFWNPWHPKMRTDLLRSELRRRWDTAGFVPARVADRLLICHLHVGLTHLMYTAYVGQWENMARIGQRMRQLAAER